MEIWKDIKNYEDLYEVSNLGRVRRKNSLVKTGIKNNEYRLIKSTILKQNLKKNGYLTVDLSRNQKVKTISVHKLVAIAFIENDDVERKTQIDHINCKKNDNRAINLEWVTPDENRNRAKKNNLYVNFHKKNIYCKELNMIFNGSYEAAEYLNANIFKNTKNIKNVAGKIRSCCLGYQKIAYNMHFEYV